VDFGLVLRRPVETAAVTGQVVFNFRQSVEFIFVTDRFAAGIRSGVNGSAIAQIFSRESEWKSRISWFPVSVERAVAK
jgi:hypothetical protein